MTSLASRQQRLDQAIEFCTDYAGNRGEWIMALAFTSAPEGMIWQSLPSLLSQPADR